MYRQWGLVSKGQLMPASLVMKPFQVLLSNDSTLSATRLHPILKLGRFQRG